MSNDEARIVCHQLERVIQGLTRHPHEVDVFSSRRGRNLELKVRVAEEDLGAVIGRGGRTARALRFLLDRRGEQMDCRYFLRILED